MDRGYFKVYRKIIEDPIFFTDYGFRTWIYCLAKANHKDSIISLNVGKGQRVIRVPKGSFVFGRKKAEAETGIDGSSIYRWIKKLEDDGYISIESNNQYSIITICNWESYQGENNNGEQLMSSQRATNEQPTSNRRATDEQPTNTYKHYKNNNNILIDKNTISNKDTKGGLGEKNFDSDEKKKIEIVFPFTGELFVAMWQNWKDYKKSDHKFTYKSAISEQAALKQLSKMADGDEQRAIEIIEYSISQGYKGLFENTKNATHIKNNRKEPATSWDELAGIVHDAFAKE